MEKFRKLGLSQELLNSVEALGYTEPSEIQEKAIPLIMEGKDVIGNSATGSGKTFAFGAGIIDKIVKGAGVQVLIMTPTRELTEQVAVSMKKFSSHYKLHIQEVYGGVSINNQIHGIKHSEIIVGTPGRLLDHLERRTLDLINVKCLILDEADRMVDMGFLPDVERIIQQCPIKRQTLLFSATITQDVNYIARKYMKSPVSVSAVSHVDPTKLRQTYYDVPSRNKFSLLAHLLRQDRSGIVMVFCNTRRNADMITQNLRRHDLGAMAIHGGLTQNKRNFIISSVHNGSIKILVCTDVAARGLDIKNVSHVYNYDIPKNSTEYIHRIGRTARAGKEGEAISIVSERDYENFRSVLRDDSLKITPIELPSFEIISVNFNQGRFRDRGDRRSGGFRGQRGYGGSDNRDSRGRGGGGGYGRGDDRGGYSRGSSRGFGRR